MTTKLLWKDRLYAAYVSSSQAGDSHSTTTEPFLPRKPYIQAIIRQHIPSNKDTKIVDLGCGHGAFLYFLQQAGYHNIHGVDVSAEQVALAHRFGITAVEQHDIGSHLGTVNDETTDVVLLMDILEHLTRPELFEILDEVFRILRPGGKFIAHVPNAEGIYGLRVRYGDLTHETAFTPQSARQLLLTVGFHNVCCFEDKPAIHGVISAVRRLFWQMGTVPARLLLAIETGGTSFVLSQNMLITATK